MSFINYLRTIIFPNRNNRTYSSGSNMDRSRTGRGADMAEIRGSDHWGPQWPPVRIDALHTVLYTLPRHKPKPDSLPGPFAPWKAPDQWGQGYVRMPCSQRNTLNRNEPTWPMIVAALSSEFYTIKDLIDSILSYNPAYRSSWKFTALEAFYKSLTMDEQQNFLKTVKSIAKLALDLPNLVSAPIPLLERNSNLTLSLTQKQISSLLANAFFCTFPQRNPKDDGYPESYPSINFARLFEAPGVDVLEKIKCFVHYFERVCADYPMGVLTFVRSSVSEDSMPRWWRSQARLAAVPLRADSALPIEDAEGLIQLDFANKYLGGGVLGQGSVQEEIRFAVCPELLVSKLFTEALLDNEALFIIGAERYSNYLGYARSFQWGGDYHDVTPFDSSARRRNSVLAIDAFPFSRPADQYKQQKINRELNKAWVGFAIFANSDARLNLPGVATGNWGCGAFGGSPQLKALLQLMACAEARRPMAYVTFGDVEFRDGLLRMYEFLKDRDVTVKQLYQLILDYCKSNRKVELWDYLYKQKYSGGPQGGDDRPKTYDIKAYLKPQKNQEPPNLRNASNSPDLFSQDKSQGSDPETPAESQTGRNTPNRKRKRENKMADSEDEMADDSTSKMAATASRMTSQTSRLFDEMQRFDEDNGRLNLTVAHTSPVNQRSSVGNDSCESTDSETEAVSELKRVRKKITDYFNTV